MSAGGPDFLMTQTWIFDWTAGTWTESTSFNEAQGFLTSIPFGLRKVMILGYTVGVFPWMHITCLLIWLKLSCLRDMLLL